LLNKSALLSGFFSHGVNAFTFLRFYIYVQYSQCHLLFTDIYYLLFTDIYYLLFTDIYYSRTSVEMQTDRWTKRCRRTRATDG